MKKSQAPTVSSIKVCNFLDRACLKSPPPIFLKKETKMKKYLLTGLILSFIFHAGILEATMISNFAVSSETYSVYSDVESIIDDIFGESYRLADWNDIVAYYQEGNDMDLFTNIIPGRTMVSYNGNRFYSPNRH
ncbi:MAG: hypothetical protein AB1847_20585 [bacterium]